MSTLRTSISLIFLAAVDSSVQAQDLSGQASVIDGDTIEIHGQRIRLHGIDAPESGQTCTIDDQTYRCGQRAANFLDTLIDNKTVHCEQKDIDRYGRIVAECFAGSFNVNAHMVESGWAIAYRDYSTDYVGEEDYAREHESGMWEGTFATPSDFRTEPSIEEVEANDRCVIKGNINSAGKKIYHLPGNTTYGRTVIDEAKGERWFCSIEDATAAGWVPVLTR